MALLLLAALQSSGIADLAARPTVTWTVKNASAEEEIDSIPGLQRRIVLLFILQ